MRKLCFVFVALLLVGTETMAEKKGFTLGIIGPLSGEYAAFGDTGRRAALMAYESLPPSEREKFSLVFEDDKLSPANTIAAFIKLTSVDNIDGVVVLASGPSNAVAPLAEKRRMPMIAIASDPTSVKGREFVVNLWVTPQAEVAVMLPEIVRRGYKKIARINAAQDGVIAIGKMFDIENRGRVSVVINEEYDVKATDFRPFLAKVRAIKDIDAIFVNLFFGQSGIFAKQAREMGINIPLMAIESFEDSSQVKAAQGALEGQWYVAPDDPDGKFFTDFRSRNPEAGIFLGANAHDAVLLFAHAIRKDPTPEGVNKFLHTVKNFSGALGTYSSTGDNLFTLPAVVKIIKGGTFKKFELSDEGKK